MSSSLYLEQYLDSLEQLPADLRRNFTLMHDLDVKNKSILEDVDAASDEYLRKVQELNAEQRRAEMEKIQAMFAKAKQNGDNKVSIAIQTYELVDKHIRKLDSDLAKFEAEMKEKGRLSQTETEDDDDDEEEAEEPAVKKKRGRTPKGAAAAGEKKRGRKPGGAKGAKESAADDKKGSKKKKSAASAAASKPAADSGVGGSGGASVASGGGGVLTGLTGVLAMGQEVIDMPVDPNEPTYCLCQQVSYGEMIGCDNVDCPIEWFHFGCMSLTTKPKGKWYCPKCIGQFKKKK